MIRPRKALVRSLVTFNIIMINLFFKIRDAKADKTYKRATQKPPAAATAATPSLPDPLAVSSSSSADLDSGSLVDDKDELIWREESPRPDQRPWRAEFQSKLPQIDVYVRYYYNLSRLFNWLLLFKNLLVLLMRFDAFAPWRYLDCYLVGRFIVNGRVIQVAPHCACFLIVIKLIWRHTMMRRAPKFRLSCIEFLLDQRSHARFWLKASTSALSRTGRLASADGGRAHDYLHTSPTSGPHARLQAWPEECHSSLLEYQNPFEESDEFADPLPGGPSKLRPNRTREAWTALALTIQKYYTIFSALFSFMILFFAAMSLPVSFTRRGFEYTYRYCVHWITSQEAAAATDGQQPGASFGLLKSTILSSIPPSRRPLIGSLRSNGTSPIHPGGAFKQPPIISEFFIHLTGDLTDLSSPYHLLRILVDILESCIIYFEAAGLLNSACFMSVILSKDITLYCKAINVRLEQYNRALERALGDPAYLRTSNYHEDELMAPEAGDAGAYEARAHRARAKSGRHSFVMHRSRVRALKAETADIQAQIADLLIMIDTYNKYMSLQSLCLLMFWLGYSALVSSWIFLPGNESPKLEWYVVHFFTTCYVLLLLVDMSEVKAECRRLYQLITVAMALDDDHERSKTIWLSLLKFYSPRPLYCFTLIGSIEITYMLGLKLLVWLVSALIVASSFFQVYNIK